MAHMSRLRHPDAVFFQNITPLAVLSGLLTCSVWLFAGVCEDIAANIWPPCWQKSASQLVFGHFDRLEFEKAVPGCGAAIPLLSYADGVCFPVARGQVCARSSENEAVS